MPTYIAYTGTDSKTIPAAPALGAKNTIHRDPTFNSRILRVTDATTAAGYSLMPEDAGYFRTFNADATALKLKNGVGNSYWIAFNAGTFSVGAVTALVGIDYKWEWSATDPDLLYYLNGNQIASYNKSTLVSTDLGGPSNGHAVTYHIAVAGADNWICSAAGPGTQDTYTEIFCIRPSDSAMKLIDIPAKTINGVSHASDPDWPTGTSIGIHSLFGSAGGQYLGVVFHNASWHTNGYAVLDLVTETWELVKNTDIYGSGHPSIGNRRWVNGCGSVDGLDSRGAVTRNVSGLMTSSEYTFIMQPPSSISWMDAEHNSWFNASSSPNNEPILFSRYNVLSPGSPAPCWYGEIVLAATDGSNKVYRFAHNHNGGLVSYYGQSFCQISNDGKWAAFSSYWDGTLGSAGALGFAGISTRIDTFILELAPTSSNPQTITFSWAPVADTDLAAYRIHVGYTYNGITTWNPLTTALITKAAAIALGHVYTVTTDTAQGQLFFPADGVYTFSISSIDTSNNESARYTPFQTKRVIRTGNKLKGRK